MEAIDATARKGTHVINQFTPHHCYTVLLRGRFLHCAAHRTDTRWYFVAVALCCGTLRRSWVCFFAVPCGTGLSEFAKFPDHFGWGRGRWPWRAFLVASALSYVVQACAPSCFLLIIGRPQVQLLQEGRRVCFLPFRVGVLCVEEANEPRQRPLRPRPDGDGFSIFSL